MSATGTGGPPLLPVSRKLQSALEAVLDIAYHGGTEPVPTRDISARQGIPNRYLEQVMQRLVRRGILRGVRGPRGGYVLARERRRVTVGEIARIVRELETSAPPTAEPHSSLGSAVLDPFWSEVQAEIIERLDAVTIQELCRRAQIAGIDSAARRSIDYTI